MPVQWTRNAGCASSIRACWALTARACSIGTMPHGVYRYTPVDFSLFDVVLTWRRNRSYLSGGFPHVVRALSWLASRAVVLRVVNLILLKI